jgi:hypothetical protein
MCQEAAVTYTMKPLSCDPNRIRGMSERMIISHYENNYGGAVKRLNSIDEKLAELDYASAPGLGFARLYRRYLPAIVSSSVDRGTTAGAASRERERSGIRQRQAIGTILGACILLGKIAIGDWLMVAIGVISLAVLFRWKVSNPVLIAATAVVGLIAYPLLQPAWVMVK